MGMRVSPSLVMMVVYGSFGAALLAGCKGDIPNGRGNEPDPMGGHARWRRHGPGWWRCCAWRRCRARWRRRGSWWWWRRAWRRCRGPGR